MERGGEPFDPEAPVVVRGEVRVEAPPERVWLTLTEVERWSRWNRRVSFATLRGEVANGTALHWRADGMNLRSELCEVEPCRRIGWVSRTPGAVGYHRWSLESHPDGGTRVVTEESWDGLIVKLLRRTLRRTLERSRRHWLASLRAEAERPIGPPGALSQEPTTGGDK